MVDCAGTHEKQRRANSLHEPTHRQEGDGPQAAGLGYLALQRGQGATAVSHLQNSLRWYAEITPPTTDTKVRALTPELIDAILRAGLAAAANQQPAQVATLFATVTRFATDMHHFPPPPLAQAMEEAATAVKSTLSADEWETAVALGQQTPLIELLTQALTPLANGSNSGASS
jgi:hypothetical protein